MIRIIAKLFVVALVLTAFLHVAPLFAAPVAYVSSTGSDANPCTVALPCASFVVATNHLDPSGQINCLNSPVVSIASALFGFSETIDCAGVWKLTSAGIIFDLELTQAMTIRNLTFSGAGGANSAIKVGGSGTLIIENCVFENLVSTALDIEPNGALNLVITNSRISKSGAGVLIKPAAGGSVTATFDRVTIVDNAGGGVKSDSTNGAVKVDISNSTISNNAGNGMNAVGGAGASTMNILNLSHNVIASNGSAGIQANGTFAAALVDTTLLDNNGTGATSAVNSGKVITYGTNRILGIVGSGFTSLVPLQ
jgi:Right handed beta helix region